MASSENLPLGFKTSVHDSCDCSQFLQYRYGCLSPQHQCAGERHGSEGAARVVEVRRDHGGVDVQLLLGYLPWFRVYGLGLGFRVVHRVVC